MVGGVLSLRLESRNEVLPEYRTSGRDPIDRNTGNRKHKALDAGEEERPSERVAARSVVEEDEVREPMKKKKVAPSKKCSKAYAVAEEQSKFLRRRHSMQHQ